MEFSSGSVAISGAITCFFKKMSSAELSIIMLPASTPWLQISPACLVVGLEQPTTSRPRRGLLCSRPMRREGRSPPGKGRLSVSMTQAVSCLDWITGFAGRSMKIDFFQTGHSYCHESKRVSHDFRQRSRYSVAVSKTLLRVNRQNRFNARFMVRVYFWKTKSLNCFGLTFRNSVF